MQMDKSYAEFVLGTYKALLVDCALQYPRLTKEFDRDYLRLTSALEHHGLHFFVEVMPSFRKHLDKCLEMKRLTTCVLTHFGSPRGRGVVPRLFRGLLLRVFEQDGMLRHQPDENAIRLLRQLLGAVRKLRLESSVKDTGNCVDAFIKTDEVIRHGSPEYWRSTTAAAELGRLAHGSFEDYCDSLPKHPGVVDSDSEQLRLDLQEEAGKTVTTVTKEHLRYVQQVADLISSTLGVFLPELWRPKHGPGAVSDRPGGSYKYDFPAWPDRLEHVFPYADFAFANYGVWSDGLSTEMDFHAAAMRHEKPARLHAVPKTLSKPRLIAAEPTSLQWCQQIVRDYFYARSAGTFIESFVDFRRQDLNGALALEASHSQTHATIDLSDASDRISCWHVERLFRKAPTLLDALRASRSLWIRQDISRYSPQFHELRKYSTMGNATTFPVQTLLFLAMALGTLFYYRGLKVTLANMASLGRAQVRVFGDDIIVPADIAEGMVELLKTFEMKVNTNKTFLNGSFRESCGVDAYDGHNVTTINILDAPRRASPESIVSAVQTHHNLMESGYVNTALFIRQTVERAGYDKIQTVQHGSGAFGWSDMVGCTTPGLMTRWNTSLHIREALCTVLAVRAPRFTAVEKHGLLQFFTEAAKKVTSPSSTIGCLARRPKLRLALRWVPCSGPAIA